MGAITILALTFAALLSYPLLLLRLDNPAGSFPRPLTSQEEREYLELAAQGDEAARGKLIEHNLRLVAHIVKKYYTKTRDQDDLISIGTIGLIKSISTYKPDKGVRLATYASRCIENEILMYFRSQRKSAGDVSLSETIDSDSDGGNLSLMDVVSDEDDVFERLTSQDVYLRLRRHVEEGLEPREREIVVLRYGLHGGKRLTQKETADKLGISRSYVSRIEKRALEKLKALLEDEERV